LEEQEILDSLKNFWRKYGLKLLGGLAIISSIVLAQMFYENKKEIRKIGASADYEELLGLLSNNKTSEAKMLAEAISTTYINTEYSRLSKLLLAQIAVSKNKVDEAITIYREICDEKSSLGLNEVAKSRLIRIYLSLNRIDEAKKLLEKIESLDGFYELKGDIEAKMNNTDKAKIFYQQAIRQAEKLGYSSDILLQKMQNLSVMK